jgi:septal ring factor EnvC (AmiA/AmiB activator)
MGFSVIGKPSKAAAVNDNSVKAIGAVSTLADKLDNRLFEVERRLEDYRTKFADTHQQVSLLGDGVDENRVSLDALAQAHADLDSGLGAAFGAIKDERDEIIKLIGQMERRIRDTQTGVQDVATDVSKVDARIPNVPPVLSHVRLWCAIVGLGFLQVALFIAERL